MEDENFKEKSMKKSKELYNLSYFTNQICGNTEQTVTMVGASETQKKAKEGQRKVGEGRKENPEEDRESQCCKISETNK